MSGAETDYIVVEVAKQVLGEDWIDGFIERAQRSGVEKVLLLNSCCKSLQYC